MRGKRKFGIVIAWAVILCAALLSIKLPCESFTCESFTCEAAGAKMGQEPGTPKPPLEELQLYAASAVLMDADSGRVLYEKNGFSRMPMASTTKIMTCIVALENCSLSSQVTVSAYAASMPKVKLFVKQGETYALEDLLFSLMLESHNDSAVVVAENIGRNFLPEDLRLVSPDQYTAQQSRQAVAAFVHLMNQKAADIGCRDTWFITPNGLDATQTFQTGEGGELVMEHSTTAADLAAIMSYCIRTSPMKERFLEITGTPSYSFTSNGRNYQLNNHNAFLNMMSGALSGKTGFTNKAGYCYVGALRREDKTFTVALLACGWPDHKSYKWSDTRKLMEYGLSHYSFHAFEEIPVDMGRAEPVPVENGCSRRLGETAYTRLSLLKEENEGQMQGLLLREDEHFELRYTLPEKLTAPVKAGETVGRAEYLLNGVPYRTVNFAVSEDVAAIDFLWCLRQVWERWRL